MSQNYIQNAIRTENQDFIAIGKRLQAKKHKRHISLVMKQLHNQAIKIDDWKKHIFYGKELKWNGGVRTEQIAQHYLTFSSPSIAGKTIMRLTHGAVGLITESAEFFEGLTKGIEKGELDKTNLKEEIGDVFWYLAQLCDELGLSFEECQNANINKLKTRYPNKFTQEDAINRKLDAEVEALNKKISYIVMSYWFCVRFCATLSCFIIFFITLSYGNLRNPESVENQVRRLEYNIEKETNINQVTTFKKQLSELRWKMYLQDILLLLCCAGSLYFLLPMLKEIILYLF